MRKTRQRDSDAPGPHSPWDETAPGPWMGGHYWTDPDGELRPAVVGDEFDLVISLFTRTGHGPGPRAEHVVAPVPDAALDAHQLHTVQRLARTMRPRPRRGPHHARPLPLGLQPVRPRRCPVPRRPGPGPAEAIACVRRGRSPSALHHAVFTSYPTAGPDIAALLVGLDP